MPAASRLEGRDITGLAPRRVWRLGVGRTFQITATFASMTVRENVQMALLSHHRRFGARLRRPRPIGPRPTRCWTWSGSATQAERACGELAYGDVKRLELAIALANAPKLLLMDEPTAGMAPRGAGRADAPDRASVARQRRIGVLFTEHDMDVVFEHADRIMVLNRGALIAEGIAGGGARRPAGARGLSRRRPGLRRPARRR